jgi:hypothetical protein
MTFHQSGFSSKWLFIKAAFHQSGFSSKRLFIKAAFHQSSFSLNCVKHGSLVPFGGMAHSLNALMH